VLENSKMKIQALVLAYLWLACACGDDAIPLTLEEATAASAGVTGSLAAGSGATPTATGSGASPAAAGSGAACSFTISLVDYQLVPAQVTVGRGLLEACAKNEGKAPHDLAIRDAAKLERGRTKLLAPGESAQFAVVLDSGQFDMFCTQAGHESLGMRGILTVN
jgi:plastocyanin